MAKDHFDKDIKLGSKVRFFGVDEGLVVCDIDNNDYTDAFSREDWSYLKNGVLVQSADIGIVYFPSLSGKVDELTVV